MFYVYVLQSQKTKNLYKGFTTDLRKRLKKHNYGGVPSTKDGIPWKLIYYEAFIVKSDALREEKFLKTGKGRERLIYLFQDYSENNNGGVPERSNGASC